MSDRIDPIPPRKAKHPGLRVLHTADWHLGKLLGEHSRQEEHERFFAFLLGAIVKHEVDLLVIAGDVFDSGNPPKAAEAQYYNFLSALFRQGGCPVVIVAGNHDSPAQLEAPKQVLQALGAHVMGAWPSTAAETLFPFPDTASPELIVAAVPFLRDRDLRSGQMGESAAEIRRSLVEGIQRRYEEVAAAARPWTDRGVPLLATGHLTVAGSEASDSEREIHVGGIGAVGVDCFPDAFSYVALGHLHRPQAAARRESVRYAGSPISLSFSEASDVKATRLLEFDGGRLVSQSAIEVPCSRRLVQVSTTRQALEADLGSLRVSSGVLPTWVEILVEDPVPGENLYDRVQAVVQGREFVVVRVVGKRTEAGAGLAASSIKDGDDIADLLAEPAGVFAHRLEAEPGLTPEEKEGLSTVFQELLSLHNEQQREADGAGGGSAVPSGGEA